MYRIKKIFSFLEKFPKELKVCVFCFSSQSMGNGYVSPV